MLRTPIIGIPIHPMTWEEALQQVILWAANHESRYIAICNTHSLITARNSPPFREALLNADLATPDGAPLAWMLKKILGRPQDRIDGPNLMWRYCEKSKGQPQSIFLLGSTPVILKKLEQNLQAHFPELVIAGRLAPPFGSIDSFDNDSIIQKIKASGATTVWVSLGCPKQELWMAKNSPKIPAVLIGVGAAFDFHAEVLQRAPPWMQRWGLEWLHRLSQDPKRLWRRYLMTIPAFIILAGGQLIAHAFSKRNERSLKSPP